MECSHTPCSQCMHNPCLVQTSLLSDLGIAMTSAYSSASPTFLIAYNAASGLSLPLIPLLQTLCVACARHPLCGVMYQTVCLYQTDFVYCLYQTDFVCCLYQTDFVYCLYQTDFVYCLYQTDCMLLVHVPDRLCVACTRQTLCVVCTRQPLYVVCTRLTMVFLFRCCVYCICVVPLRSSECDTRNGPGTLVPTPPGSIQFFLAFVPPRTP